MFGQNTKRGKMKKKQVLIVEDAEEIANLVSLHIQDLGCETCCVGDGALGLQEGMAKKYDLIILDLMLPKLDGMEVCKQLRQEKVYTPILILTAKSEVFDKVIGLELGADDYLTKPFNIRELLARVKAIFRRTEIQGGREEKEPEGNKPQGDLAEAPPKKEEGYELRVGELWIDSMKRKVLLKGEKVDLTAKEFDLLYLFACHPGRCYSRQQLLDHVWGSLFDGYDHTVNSHINRLRSKIEENVSKPRYIQTVWGVGYQFAEINE